MSASREGALALAAPGQAALFVLADRVSSERVLEKLGPFGGRVLRTNLDRSQEQKVRDAIEHAARQNATAAETAAYAAGEGAPAT